jgi:selenide,water dikinase
LPLNRDPRVLIDFRSSDDAGVYAWEGGPALVQTVDFFTPIVDDPFTYGQIAAANSLSDVYAMGGRPLTALAIAGFPKTGIGNDVIAAIFRGGHDKLAEAGVALLGGHTVQDPEIKFGYAVTGAVDPRRIWSNAGAQPGDRLLLTKAIGTGVVATAVKNGRAPDAVAARAVESMRTLNKAAAEALHAFDGVHACTDITGFGLIGHASEVANASGATLVIESARVPLLDGVLPLVRGNRAGGMKSNREYFGGLTKLAAGLDEDLLDLLYDPQTSGGLLVCVAADRAEGALRALLDAGVPAAAIGQAVAPTGHWIEVR